MPALPRSIRGHVAIVTGAAAGMGKATALLFGQEGAHVAVTDRDAEGAAAVAGEIVAAGGSAAAWALDVAHGDRILAVAGEVAARWRGIDIVVNNAGVARLSPVDAPDYEAAWETLQSVLLHAHVRMVRAALPHLRRSAHPRVVNIASTEALGASSGNSAYAAAKAGVTGLTARWRWNSGGMGSRSTASAPGRS